MTGFLLGRTYRSKSVAGEMEIRIADVSSRPDAVTATVVRTGASGFLVRDYITVCHDAVSHWELVE